MSDIARKSQEESHASLKEIADRLVAHCRNRTEAEGLNTLYAQDTVSVEAMAMSGTFDREARRLDAIRGKHDWWKSQSRGA